MIVEFISFLLDAVFTDFKLLIMASTLTSPNESNDDYKRILERIEDIMQGYVRSATHMVNELSRIRKHHREDKNDVVDEICRQHRENIQNFRDISESANSLIRELQHMRQVMEALVHSYNNDVLNQEEGLLD